MSLSVNWSSARQHPIFKPDPTLPPRWPSALGAFGAPLQELRAGDLERPGLIFQIGVAPNRIDVLTAIDGLTFGDAWPIGKRRAIRTRRFP